MSLNISNTTPAGVIANPDYWSPPFSLEGCLYAGLFHLDDLSKNLAGDNSPSTVIGTVARDGLFPRFNANTFRLVTGVTLGTGDASFICLYNKSTAIPHDNSTTSRGFLMSSYGGGSNGMSLTVEGTADTANPANIAGYRAAADVPTNAIFANGASSGSTDGWALSGVDAYFDTDGTTARVIARNYLNGGSASGSGVNKPGWAASTAPVAIGGRPLAASGTTQVTIAAAFIYNRILTSTERAEILSYLRQYMAARGITL